MKFGMELTRFLAAAALTSAAHGRGVRPSVQDISCSTPAVLDVETNVWEDHTLYPASYYRNEVKQAVEAIDDAQLREKAAKVADVGIFVWIKATDDITHLAEEAKAVPCDNILGLVLDGLPNKEPNILGLESVQYQASYIDAIADVIKSSPNTAFAVIIEPGAFPAYFNETTASSDLAKSYREDVPYALQALDLPNVVTYLDVGNSNSLDWEHQRDVAAEDIAAIYEEAGNPSQFRGFASNVANYNAWDLNPGEFIPADDSPYPRPQNEHHFVGILSDALQKHGLPSRATHAIMDTSRNGVPGLRWTWDDWCNVNGAGLGPKPMSETGDERLDAFVWVAHPGESDGASDPSAPEYDEACAREDAFKPSPAAGQWHQVYFEMLVQNADPAL